jgi:hypothetical protein
MMNGTNMQKKHCEMIKAWADGYEIEAFNPEHQKWVTTPEPGWFDSIEYRVKPGEARRPRITEIYAMIDLNPFTGEPELHTNESQSNIILRFENDDLVDINMVGEPDDEPLPWE